MHGNQNSVKSRNAVCAVAGHGRQSQKQNRHQERPGGSAKIAVSNPHPISRTGRLRGGTGLARAAGWCCGFFGVSESSGFAGFGDFFGFGFCYFTQKRKTRQAVRSRVAAVRFFAGFGFGFRPFLDNLQ